MTYRDFAMPDFATQEHLVSDWMDWMESSLVLIPTAPRPADSCRICQGAVGPKGDVFWDRCFQCRGYDEHLDAFVPITYSVASGLESVLHCFKDFGDQYAWMASPLGCLLHSFLSKHRGCIERKAHGGIDVAAYVPSNRQERTFSQLDRMIDAVKGSPVRWSLPWDPGVLQRDFSEERPGRAEVKPVAYTVNAGAVTGKRVLLLDDTWTSGSSLVSSAAALKGAGASYVVGLTIGRQLNEGGHYGSTDKILTDVRGRRWTDDDCVLCT